MEMKRIAIILVSILFLITFVQAGEFGYNYLDQIIGNGVGNISSFLDLTDVLETTYSGKAGLIPTVNSGETGLIFTAISGGNGTGITNISEAGDVDVSGVSDNDILKWDDAVKKWVGSTFNSILTFGDNWNYFSGNNEITFNETKLNESIDARAGGGGGSGKAGDDIYLYNDTSTMFFNETKLNSTIILVAGSQLNSTNYLGSDFSGPTGDLNRTLNIGIDIAIVDMERQSLHPDIDYEITAGVLKIFLPVFDQFRIMVTTKLGLKSFNYLGTDLSGANPTKFISFSSTPITITLERQSLISGTDYSFNGTDINFNVFITDAMRITIWE